VRLTVPVLPLVEDVPLTVGVIVAGGTVGVGVLADERLPIGPDEIDAAVREAFHVAGGRDLSGVGTSPAP